MPFHPIDAASSCVRRARRFLALAQERLPDSKIKTDLRRSALVMAVTAVDSYMHWLVYRRVSDVRREGDLPKVLSKLDVPFSDMASLADAAIDARRTKHDLRPWVQVKNAVQRRLLRETFQSYDQIGQAFALAGIEKGWSRTADVLGVKPDEIKDRLNHLVQRRNQVVHEEISNAHPVRNA
jgi:HEPN superfamily RiboL-PSP-like protein